jgi:formate transporter
LSTSHANLIFIPPALLSLSHNRVHTIVVSNEESKPQKSIERKQGRLMDSLMPDKMAVQAEEAGIKKANRSFSKTLVLAILAGAFIAFGAIFATVVTAEPTLSTSFTKLLGGVAFSLGLILVIIGGAELFTGNNLIVMAWANGRIKTTQVLRNWSIVFLGNFIGAISMAILMLYSLQYSSGSGSIGAKALSIANAKCSLGFAQAIVLGILCNTLVCLAVWLCYSAKRTSGKILSILFPITAFVAAGFEHSVANMYFIPKALLIKASASEEFWTSIGSSPEIYENLTWTNFFVDNLLPVTIGNIIGGAVLVGLVYWFVYLKGNMRKS